MRRATVANVLVVAALVVGCTSTSAGEPLPGDTLVPGSTAPDSHDAPRVDEPLDAARYLNDPCAVLGREQLAGFGVVGPGQADTGSTLADTVGPQCFWQTSPEENSTIGVGFVVRDQVGLATLYALRDEQAYFEETTVGDYPAVFHSYADQRADGICNISVGISNTLFFRTSEYGDTDATRSCARAKNVAEAVVTTLRKGAS
ncbi:hypothetical protein BLA60_32385 [Actinophytocola xinjiangensis]|uniref:DUF3558 domain-containing protein n=1 Tax=Actinophytocola xinjiangensis TaxID=485602 RepID=A0A7Z0WG00_9PSEU|nr:DUF3558 domain-containing protein [Actinophytocola xinjiangensis]OLF06335.1 hypothetical protein BLA60_32385 [Actinophytocola xinjiangensis]